MLHLAKAKALLEGFEKYEIQQLPGSEKSYVDALANIGSLVNYSLRQTIPFKYLATSSIHELNVELVATIDTQENWMHEIINYIQVGKIPNNATWLENWSKRLQDTSLCVESSTVDLIQDPTFFVSP